MADEDDIPDWKRKSGNSGHAAKRLGSSVAAPKKQAVVAPESRAGLHELSEEQDEFAPLTSSVPVNLSAEEILSDEDDIVPDWQKAKRMRTSGITRLAPAPKCAKAPSENPHMDDSDNSSNGAIMLSTPKKAAVPGKMQAWSHTPVPQKRWNPKGLGPPLDAEVKSLHTPHHRAIAQVLQKVKAIPQEPRPYVPRPRGSVSAVVDVHAKAGPLWDASPQVSGPVWDRVLAKSSASAFPASMGEGLVEDEQTNVNEPPLLAADESTVPQGFNAWVKDVWPNQAVAAQQSVSEDVTSHKTHMEAVVPPASVDSVADAGSDAPSGSVSHPQEEMQNSFTATQTGPAPMEAEAVQKLLDDINKVVGKPSDPRPGSKLIQQANLQAAKRAALERIAAAHPEDSKASSDTAAASPQFEILQPNSTTVASPQFEIQPTSPSASSNTTVPVSHPVGSYHSELSSLNQSVAMAQQTGASTPAPWSINSHLQSAQTSMRASLPPGPVWYSLNPNSTSPEPSPVALRSATNQAPSGSPFTPWSTASSTVKPAENLQPQRQLSMPPILYQSQQDQQVLEMEKAIKGYRRQMLLRGFPENQVQTLVESYAAALQKSSQSV
jgi:hypothetical protein